MVYFLTPAFQQSLKKPERSTLLVQYPWFSGSYSPVVFGHWIPLLVIHRNQLSQHPNIGRLRARTEGRSTPFHIAGGVCSEAQVRFLMLEEEYLDCGGGLWS